MLRIIIVTAFVPLISGVPLALPNPLAQNDDGSERSGTDKCDRFQYEEWLGEQVSCETEAAVGLNELLKSFDFTDEELRASLCSTIRGRVACFEKNGPNCFNADSIEGIRLNIIYKEFQKFFNLTETLGRELVDDCPTMVKYEPDLLKELTGSDRCNFHEYEDSRMKMQKCRSEAVSRRRFRLQLLDIVPNPREFLGQVVCQEKADFLGCSEAFQTCLAPENLKEHEGNEKDYFAGVEEQIVEVIPEFDIDKSCGEDGSFTLGSAGEEEEEEEEFGVDTGLTRTSDAEEAIEKLEKMSL